jgi:ATPase subunit of ABC transporter with duplicated ATPase domains
MTITLEAISKKFSGRLLFDNVSASFRPGCRYGLTGPNGSGKSTLLKIMMGLEPSDSGYASLPEKVGFLKQNIEDFQNVNVVDAVIMGNNRLWDAMQEKEQLYQEEMSDEIGIKLAELEEIISEEDGYSAESEAESLLSGLGIDQDYFLQKMKTLPIDRQFRVLICQALFGKPKALLLDEPTNHLDLDSIKWLEEFLHNYEGVLLVISHDRHFLNAITTHIADLDYETVILYPGNYDQMILAKTSVRTRTEEENKSKEKKVAQLQEFVSRFGAGTRASQVQSRLREIEKLQPSDLKKSNIQKPYIRFVPTDKQAGKIVFKVDDLCKSYDKPVIDHFSFDVSRGDKIAVIGNNGKGKTTLLKMLAQVLEPDSGKVAIGHQVDLGYFPQNHQDVLEKTSTTTLFDWLKAKKEKVYDQEVRGVLGKMLFGGDDAFKEIKNLSGGETARLIIAGLMLTQPNVLVLDEPNNHLDLEAVSALAWGLEEFKGTVVFASHDRDLIARVATKLIVFDEEGLHVFLGPLDEYLQQHQNK